MSIDMILLVASYRNQVELVYPKKEMCCRTHGCLTEYKGQEHVWGRDWPRELGAFGKLVVLFVSHVCFSLWPMPSSLCGVTGVVSWRSTTHLLKVLCSWTLQTDELPFSSNSEFLGQRIWWTQNRSAVPTRFRGLRSWDPSLHLYRAMLEGGQFLEKRSYCKLSGTQ